MQLFGAILYPKKQHIFVILSGSNIYLNMDRHMQECFTVAYSVIPAKIHEGFVSASRKMKLIQSRVRQMLSVV